MFSKDLPASSPFWSTLCSFIRASATAFFGPGKMDEWEPLYANDPRFDDDDYEVVFATTRSAF